jgi:hypothetical protein
MALNNYHPIFRVNPIRAQGVWALLVLGCVAIASFGCRVVGPYAGSTPSLQVNDRSADEVRDTTAQVFRENGYEVSQNTRKALSFIKPGSRRDNLTYASSMEPVWIHVEVSITPTQTGSQLVCRVHLVQGRGLLEEELTWARPDMAPYQKMLDEVGKRLAQN